MIQPHNKYILILCLLVSSLAINAASEAEYVKLSKTYILRPDGSQETRIYKELTLFTHTAMNQTYGESFIVYNPLQQEVKIHSSYTRQKDGNIVKTPENAFVEVLPANAANAPAYNYLKELVIVHTGLELGATIVLDYSIISKPGYLPELDIFEPIAQTSPVKEYDITLNVPEGKSLQYEISSMKVKPVITSSNGIKQVKWSLRNIAASSRAPWITPAEGDIPLFSASTYSTAAKALETLNNRFSEGNKQQIETFVTDLLKGQNTDTEKLNAIVSYVTEQLDNSRLSLSETGFRIRPADEIIRSAYATTTEKTALLSILLKKAGLSAETAAYYQAELPTEVLGLSAIAGFTIRTVADGKEYLLSPTSKTISPIVWKHTFVPILSLDNSGKKIMIPTPSDKIDYKVTISFSTDENKIAADSKISSQESVAFFPYFQTDMNLKNGLATNLFSRVQSLKDNTGYSLVKLPDSRFGYAHMPYTRLNSSRNVNLLLPRLCDEQYTYTITLPDTLINCSPNMEKKLNNRIGDLFISIKQNGQTINITRSLKLKKQLITPQEYSDFRQLMMEWNDTNTNNLLIKTNK
ncbi:DUF3857 domain-containing protein [Coprobacter tertius]|uniref:DUF3857 domain-containing protein n=1 Tax=Coprobacter tertius TaxID=2944915 RepID=A0ABT1MI35_9BACT|nr:DUF3857 domain-containing protein [Coprobacter tertius]MCP9612287.1 DUF3857 domain-containing protein [Coprobacter tertius]